MTDTFFSIREVANRLGVKWYRVKYAHMAGLVPEPMRVGNHRLYDEVDVRRLEVYFSRKGGNENIQHEREDLPCMEER
jgi:DNA-binding transcriptional MerR regulator